MTPQAQTILKHLQQHGTITNVEANAVYKARSVSRRITEIMDAGYVVGKTHKVDATGQRYVRYEYLGLRLDTLTLYVNREGAASFARP